MTRSVAGSGHRRLPLSRRGFLGLAGGVVATTLLGSALPTLARQDQTGKLLRSEVPLPAPFESPLRVPPILTPGRHPDHRGADYYEITERVARQEILPGVSTEIWGYDGLFPGPTIVSHSGRRTVVRHRNLLPVPTVTHLHGGHTPSASDGFPTDLVLPQSGGRGHEMPMRGMPGMPADPQARIDTGFRDYDYPMQQRATTLWYHDHRMGFTAADLWRGLAGFHLIHDGEEDALPLPRGDRDIPLMIMDRSFAADGSLVYPAIDATAIKEPGTPVDYMGGVFGDVVLVNGVPWPVLEVAACRYRFRFLNASNARRYRLTLSPPPPGGAGLVQIGSDGGLLERPLSHDAIDIAPAERFDVIIDFSRYPVGQHVTVENQLGRGSMARIMRFHVTRKAPDDSVIPQHLSSLQRLDPAQAEVTRDFKFQFGGADEGWTINGHRFDPTRPEAEIRLGATEIWRFTADLHHSVHVHLVQFQVLSRNGEEPGPYDAGWKDTVDLRPAEETAVIARFDGYRGRYVMHCHNLEHEDMAMMATIAVV